jgi:hypothetical protein
VTTLKLLYSRIVDSPEVFMEPIPPARLVISSQIISQNMLRLKGTPLARSGLCSQTLPNVPVNPTTPHHPTPSSTHSFCLSVLLPSSLKPRRDFAVLLRGAQHGPGRGISCVSANARQSCSGGLPGASTSVLAGFFGSSARPLHPEPPQTTCLRPASSLSCAGAVGRHAS